ncbi:hypothetical protein A2661_00975 [Candidatus Giovannonibacteria bacterium RIFCSPHIGHO2_01_FULL_45_24]|uniref:Protein-export membrane protein SecG n=1 Tax=Candidatus Giovannonibacteria bacterium RIFCSPLOWO2_01_FULL_46_32 TaxID=1798353 RepID=A0A1F5XF82_9BACT|nr:MAG: hypothetical protein A2661_00975 [Candidatus Giovannonibacteria bacterium RIFCSPHIGHO2_01_FULL_45_24]OGF86592.1 MAG: hypothetical protein A3B19_00060 [Candidatus Giovannonibacteria bacterium RIFCSPLOWO2_01_FULL_46_32]
MPQAQAKTIDDIIGIVQMSIIDPITILLFALAAVVFLFGVVEFIAGASAGEASASGGMSFKTRARGKKHMTWGIVGLVVMTSAKAIIAVLQNFFK